MAHGWHKRCAASKQMRAAWLCTRTHADRARRVQESAQRRSRPPGEASKLRTADKVERAVGVAQRDIVPGGDVLAILLTEHSWPSCSPPQASGAVCRHGC